jgi:hypothetical protein
MPNEVRFMVTPERSPPFCAYVLRILLQRSRLVQQGEIDFSDRFPASCCKTDTNGTWSSKTRAVRPTAKPGTGEVDHGELSKSAAENKQAKVFGGGPDGVGSGQISRLSAIELFIERDPA